MMDFIGGVWYLCCGWILVGAIAGAVARQVMGRRDAPLVLDIVLGVAGAFIGGIIVGWLGFDETLDIGFGIGSIITAFIGAAVLLFIGNFVGIGRR